MDMRVMRNEIQTASYIESKGQIMLSPGLKAIKVNGHELQVDFVSRNFMAVDIRTRMNLTVIGAASTNTAEDEMSCIDTISIPITLCNRSLSSSAFLMDNC